MQSEIRTEQTGASREGLTLQSIKDFLIPVPPIAEQREIIAAVGETTESIERTSLASQKQIALINEYRTRLIADAVTGQLDVRGAAIRIPD